MDAEDFVSVSVRVEAFPAAQASLRAAMQRFIDSLREALRRRGGVRVGHIKGMVEDGESPPLFFSLTSLDAEAGLKGGPLKEGAWVVLSVTAIVAGIDRDELSRLLRVCLGGHFLPAPGERRASP
ncbi:MAG: hypothetical protein H5T74_05910 [Actinobacteria bacterium]|nr:hypothetical protein [Actinomycetota bacterium]MDI6830704.1 hypothetical protein [Actinomycetota bacterium]